LRDSKCLDHVSISLNSHSKSLRKFWLHESCTLREFSEVGAEYASGIINIFDNDGEKIRMMDLMVYFDDPNSRYDQERIYNYIFPDLMEEFRDDESLRNTLLTR
jgi:hypothetical protein